MMRKTVRQLYGLVFLLVMVLVSSCGSARIGRKFTIDPRGELKVGHDRKSDVLRKMGQPYRKFVDSDGREVFTYVWADGKGGGEKCTIAFNKNGMVYLVEVSP